MIFKCNRYKEIVFLVYLDFLGRFVYNGGKNFDDASDIEG